LEGRRIPHNTKDRQFMPRPANSAAWAAIAKGAKHLDFQGKVIAAGWHEACDIDRRQQSIWNFGS
jgi:hypothetical protein